MNKNSLKKAVPLGYDLFTIVGTDVIERKIMEKELRQSKEELAFLLKLTDILRSTSNPIEVHKTVTSTAMDYFKSDRCYFCEIENNKAIIRQDSYKSGLQSVSGVYPLSSLPIHSSLMESGNPFVIQDVRTTDMVDEELRQLCIQLSAISYIDVPVLKDGKLVGLLCISQFSPRTWTDAEIELAVDVAGRTWIAVGRAKAEEALQKSEDKYHKLFEASNDGFWWADKDGYIIETDDDLPKMLGYKKGEIIGMYWTDFIYEECLDKGLKEWDSRKSGNSNRYEIRLKKKDGSSIWVRVSGSPMMDKDGKYAGTLIAFKDINQQMIALEKLSKSEEKALSLVSQLKEVDKNKNDFINMLSHELRNPLATISNGIMLLEFQNNNEASLRTLEVLKRQTSHLSKLVDDLLDITRISQKKIVLNKEFVDLNKIIRDAIEDIKPQFEEKGINFTEDISAQPIAVNVDPLRITQCILNILTNALKFTEKKGTVDIALNLEAEKAVISIKDNGIGISPELLPRVFEPFKQDISSYSNYNNMGLGLGLSIVKDFIEIHDGSISVNSPGIGKGSTFTMKLPICRTNK